MKEKETDRQRNREGFKKGETKSERHTGRDRWSKRETESG